MGVMKVKNIILYIVGILCCIGALALFVRGGFVPERQTATLLLVFLLGLTAVAVMDLIDEPEVIFLISHRRLRKGLKGQAPARQVLVQKTKVHRSHSGPEEMFIWVIQQQRQ